MKLIKSSLSLPQSRSSKNTQPSHFEYILPFLCMSFILRLNLKNSQQGAHKMLSLSKEYKGISVIIIVTGTVDIPMQLDAQ